MAPLLALLCATIGADTGRMMRATQARVIEAATREAARQAATLRNTVNLLHVLASVPVLQTRGPECNAFLAKVAAGQPYVTGLSVTDGEGSIICGSLPDAIGLNKRDQPFFQDALQLAEDESYAMSQLQQSRVSGKPRVFVAVKLEAASDSGARGIVFAALRPGWLERLTQADADSETELLDSRDGALLGRGPRQDDLIGTHFPDSALVRAFSASHSPGTIEAEDPEGTRRVYGYAPLPGFNPGLLIAVGLPSHVVHAQATRAMLLAIGLGLAMATLAALGSWFISDRNLMRPLRILAAAAEELGAGDTSHRAELPRSAPAELQTMADAFRLLVKRLQMRDLRLEAMQLEMRESESNHRLLAEASTDMITRFSANLRRIYVSPACRDLLGYEPEELIGRTPGEIVHPDDWQPLDAALNQPLLDGQPTARATYRAFRKDKTQIWLESCGRSLLDGDGFVVVTRDVTERKVLEEQLAAANGKLSLLATQDALTGLANRRRFDESLDHEYRAHARTGRPLAVILLDVDRFKLFNDSYGHPAGDACLKKVAAAISGALLRPQDLAARYGGEEFALVLPDTGQDGAFEVAERVQQAIRDANIPQIGSVTGIVTVSMGIATTGDEHQEVPNLIAEADLALYRAKHDGRNRICLAAVQPSIA